MGERSHNLNKFNSGLIISKQKMFKGLFFIVFVVEFESNIFEMDNVINFPSNNATRAIRNRDI